MKSTKPPPPNPGNIISRVRQWIESVNQTLKGQLDLEAHGGRTVAGVFTRIAQQLLALAAGIWHWSGDMMIDWVSPNLGCGRSVF